jgi:hypothetical protein
MVGVYAGTEPVLSGVHSYAGFIDVIDMRAGVRGWAVDLRNPQAGVTLELCVGKLVVASTATVLEREDIASKLGTRSAAGFAFLPELLEAAAGLTAAMDDEITVRVAGSRLSLASAGGPCTVADVLDSLRAARAPEPASTIADLELLLDSLRAGAATLGERPLLPLPENLQGYLETLAVDAAGQVWFMGWIRRGHVQEFSAIIVERRKFPAALAVMSYTRDDLPPDCCGLVGLISSSWRPSSATSNLHLFFGHEGRFFLKSHTPLRIIPVGELVGEYEGVRDRCLGDGRSTVLQRMLGSLDSWVPTRSVAQSYATETSVDRILLVPGLGCLVEGWVLSPIKRVEGLRLRVGASVMSADANSLHWKPRPDLLEAFPNAVAMTAQAGFVGLFVGDAEPEDFADPMLKIIFQGGHSTNAAIHPGVFRRLGHSANLEDALAFFPALQEEAFFPRFAEAAIQAERAAMNPPVALSLAPARKAMVFVLPKDRCDLFLLFEDLAAQCRTRRADGEEGRLTRDEPVPGPGIEAVVFVAGSRNNRSDALWLFRDFQATHGAANAIACSLLVIDDASQGFALLPDILREVGASRFVFVGPDVFLKPAGWERARLALESQKGDLVFFGIQSEAFEHRDLAAGTSARCFAWSTAAFLRWALEAPAFLGGFFRDNGLFQRQAGHTVLHNTARAARMSLPTRTQEAVNAVIYAAMPQDSVRGFGGSRAQAAGGG